MYIRKTLQKRIMISMLSVLVLVLTLIGSSYALFMDVASNTNDQVLTVGELQITFLEGNTIDIEDLHPMTDAVAVQQLDNIYAFTVDNRGTVAYKFEIRLHDNPDYADVPDNKKVPHQFIRYSLDHETPSRVLSEAEGNVIFEGTINPGSARLFTIRVWVNGGDPVNPVLGLPNSVLGAQANLSITIDGRAAATIDPCVQNPNTADCRVLAAHGGLTDIIARGTPNFGAISTNENTLYAMPDEHGMSLYFRGNHSTNNNVVFAGHQWKIIRIDGQRNIRMIYNGPCTGNTCTILGNTSANSSSLSAASAFNGTANSNRFAGYVMGAANTGTFDQQHANTTNSTVKIAVDAWFNNNANFTAAQRERLTTGYFCIDRTPTVGTGLGTTATTWATNPRITGAPPAPTLSCDRRAGNLDRVELLVGLISADEVALAGGRNGIANNDYFLRTNAIYWTLSPNAYAGTAAQVFTVAANGGLTATTNVNTTTVRVRPVITLRGDVTFARGNGSLANPFVVE